MAAARTTFFFARRHRWLPMTRFIDATTSSHAVRVLSVVQVAYEAIRKSWDEGNSSRAEQARVSRMRYLGEKLNPPKGSTDQDVGTFPWEELAEVAARVLEADVGCKQRVIAAEEKVALREGRTRALKVSSEKLSAMNTERQSNKEDKGARMKKLRTQLKNPVEHYQRRKMAAWALRAKVSD